MASAPVPGRAVLDCLAGQVKEDLPVLPADTQGPTRFYQDLLPEPPVAGIDNQVAHLPGRVVDDEVVDVADGIVESLHVVAANLGRGAQVSITDPTAVAVVRRRRAFIPPTRRKHGRIGSQSPDAGAAPVHGKAEVAVEIDLVLA
jgi:hypothetical protein